MKRLYFIGVGLALAYMVSAFSMPQNNQTNFLPLLIPPHAEPGDTKFCPPLPLPTTGVTVTVGTVEELRTAVNAAAPYTTIFLENGTYNISTIPEYLQLRTPNVTLRSLSGNRDAVILEDNYTYSEIVSVSANNVTIADLTVRHSDDPIHVVTNGSTPTLNTLIYNVHVADARQQAIKINPNVSGAYLGNGTVACSLIELTDAGRPNVDTQSTDCYTGGVDAHGARNWTIRDNLIRGFWCLNGGLAEHGIHMWSNSQDTLVERNRVIDNVRGIGFGLGDSPHTGGIIRNNMVRVIQDVGIGLESAPNARVYNNTVYVGNNYDNAIEYRFNATTGVQITNNLTNRAIANRGGSATAQNNVTNAQASWFVNAAAGDLHLASNSIATVIDQALTLTEVTDDFDGATRPIGSASDIGADEYGIPAPTAVTNLRISQTITRSGTLTATLLWTPPANALTATLRYSTSPITAGNWNSATLLANTLPGNANTYTAVVPYSGGIIYFALKTEGTGGESGLSNNAFWPTRHVYLPIILKP